MAHRKYIDRSGESLERHMDSGAFLVPSPSMNLSGLSGSYAGEEGDLRNPAFSRMPATAKIAPEGTYKQIESTVGVTDDQLQDMFLMHMVPSTQNMHKSKPIEYYESLLYSATSDWAVILSRKDLPLDCVEEMHHVEQLRKHESELTEEEMRVLNQVRQQLLINRPMLETEYRVFSLLLEVVSGLALKWGVFSESNYSHRTKSSSMGGSTFDLVELSNNLFNAETFWLASMLGEDPLTTLVPENAKALAQPMVEATNAAFGYLLLLNSEAEFEKYDNIDVYLASKCEEFAQMTNLKYGTEAQMPKYQALDLPQGLFARCRRRPELIPLRTLKKLIERMEDAYQRFESALFNAFLTQS